MDVKLIALEERELRVPDIFMKSEVRSTLCLYSEPFPATYSEIKIIRIHI